MYGLKYYQTVCEGILDGKQLIQIAKELNVSYIFIKRVVRAMVDAGVLYRNPPFSVRAGYKEYINEKIR